MKPRMPASLFAVGLSVTMAVSQPVFAQSAPEADPADVSSIDAIMTAVYDVISGPAGEQRDWNRFRSLFWPGAQLIPTGPSQSGGVGARRMTVDEYVTGGDQMFSETPFFETEVNRVTERYGSIAHAFSTYESRNAPEEAPFISGINSFQLLHDGNRWWVVNIFWADTRVSGEIPAKYMHN